MLNVLAVLHELDKLPTTKSAGMQNKLPTDFIRCWYAVVYKLPTDSISCMLTCG